MHRGQRGVGQRAQVQCVGGSEMMKQGSTSLGEGSEACTGARGGLVFMSQVMHGR